MGMHSQNTIIAIKKIWPTRVDLTGGSVAASTITSITQSMVANHYRGGKMIVLDGNQAGKEYKVTANGVNSITVDHANLTESENAVANTDSVALFPIRTIPVADNAEWILIDSAPGFTPTKEWSDLFAQRSGNLPYRKDSYLLKNILNETLEYTFQDASFLPLMFGKCVDTGTTAGTPLSTTITADAHPGENKITVAATTNGLADDIIRVGSGTDGENCKITDITGSVITIEPPLMRYHASGSGVTELDTNANYTHTYTEFYGHPQIQVPFVVKAVYKSQCGNNSIAMWINYQVSAVTMKNDGDKLTFSVSVKGVNFRYKEGYVEGSDDTSTNAAFLTDSTADFVEQGVNIGQTVYNVTDGSTATITAVTKTTITGTLSGGTDDDWDSGDVYYVDIFDAPTELTDAPALYYNSEVSINGTVDGTVKSVNVGYDLQAEEKFFQNDYTSGYPSLIDFKRPSHTAGLGIRVEDGKFLDLLEGGSKFDNYAKYSLASDTTNHYIKIEMKNCRPNSTPHPFPAGGPFEGEMSLSQQYLQVTVVDDNPYHR